MTTFSKSFDDLFGDLTKEYDNFVPAAALLWWRTSTQFGLRIEATELMVEFTNGTTLGRDPEGTLFFYNDAEFEGTVNYDVSYSTTSDVNQRCFVIRFYFDSPDRSFAQFIARDINGVVNYTTKATGTWQPLTACSAAAHVEKLSTEPKWTMTIPSINMKAAWSYESGIHEKIDVWGTLTFKQVNDIAKGLFIDYQNDRIVFTETKEWSLDYRAFFLPVETTENPNPLGTYLLTHTGAIWSGPVTKPQSGGGSGVDGDYPSFDPTEKQHHKWDHGGRTDQDGHPY